VKVHLKQIPPEGLHLEGEEDCLIPELETEGVRCLGAMQYKIDIGVSEGSLWANGSLKQPIEPSETPMSILYCIGPTQRTPSDSNSGIRQSSSLSRCNPSGGICFK